MKHSGNSNYTLHESVNYKQISAKMENIDAIFERQNNNGGKFWSRTDGDIHAPHGYSTIDTLSVLGELEVTTNKVPFLTEVIEFVYTYQTPDGSFKYSKTSSKLPCMTARILSAFGKINHNIDRRSEKSYKQLLDTQWADGGWRCNTVKLGKSILTDASNPGTTLYVLDAFRFRKNSISELIQLEKGVDFILQHWQVKEPVGPCNFGIGSRFLQIEYPFLRYNIFYFVYVLSFYKKAINDNRFLEVYKYLDDKIENDCLEPENPHKAWRNFDFAKKGKVSEVASKRWIEIKENMKNN